MNNLENSQAPYNFGVCASADCTKRFTCLRYIALQNASPQYPFLPTLSPRKLESMKGECELPSEYAGALRPRFHPGGRVADGSGGGYIPLAAYFLLRA